MKTINTYINEKLRLSAKNTYTCQPQTKKELVKIIKDRIKDEGPECDLNDIDTSKIKDMSLLFDVIEDKIFVDFNGDVSQWDVSNVRDMHCMFFGCRNFDSDISKWNVSNVRDMYNMFNKCKNFNQDLSKWDTSKVESMGNMFRKCEKFDCDLSSWNVSNANNMYFAFTDCPTTPTWYDKTKWERY